MTRRQFYVHKNQIVVPDRPRFYFPKRPGVLSREASAHWDKGLQKYTEGSINLSSNTIKVRLGRTSAYTFSQAHEFASSLPAAIETDVTLGSKVLSGGTFDAADAVFSAFDAGAALDFVAVFKFVTADADSPLLAYLDGFSVTPNGGDITLQWAASTPFIFKV